MKKPMSVYKCAGYLLLIVSVFYIAAQFILPFFVDGSDLMQSYAIATLVVTIIGTCLPTTLFFKKDEGRSFGRTKVTGGVILWSIMLGLGVFQLTTGLSAAYYEGFAAIGIEPVSVSAGMPSTEGWRLFATIALIALVPAIVEEQFIHGALLQSWRSMGRKKSVLLTAVIFGLLHLNPFNLPFTIGIGILLGILAYESESIYPAITVHFVNNLMAVLISHTANNTAAASAEPATGANLWLLIAIYVVTGGVITVLSFKQVRKNITSRPASADERDKGVRLPIILSLFILLLFNAVMFAIQMGWLAL